MNIRAKDFLRVVKELAEEIVKGEAQPPGAHVWFIRKKVVEGIFHRVSFVLGYSQCLRKARRSQDEGRND
jgi:hypothetical protein